MKRLLIIATLLCAVATAPRAHSTVVSQPLKEHVYICVSRSAHKYHAYECRGLKRCTHEVKKVTKGKAVELGYSACKICY